MTYQAPKPKPKKKAKLLLVPASIVAVCAAILLDSSLRLVTTEYDIYSARLPAAFEGFRIVQLSDLHGREFGENNSRLVQAVKAAAPDIIVLTGDYIEGLGELPSVEVLAEQLVQLAPTYFVSGNHDWGSRQVPALRQLLADCGVTYLSNECVTLTRGESQIVLAGVEDPNGYADMKTPEELVSELRAAYPDDFIALLGHRNYWVEKYPYLDVDLIFSGHGHGGMVRLPFIGGVFGTSMDLFPDYVDGTHRSGTYTMVVSRGLAGNAMVPRFLNNPEVVAVTLHAF